MLSVSLTVLANTIPLPSLPDVCSEGQDKLVSSLCRCGCPSGDRLRKKSSPWPLCVKKMQPAQKTAGQRGTSQGHCSKSEFLCVHL